MRLDRNINANGDGKYAIIKVRRLREVQAQSDLPPGDKEDIESSIKCLEAAGILEWTKKGGQGEFFLIRLKDKYAADALAAYALSAQADGNREYADEIFEMAARAGTNSPWCKRPD